MLTPKSFKTEDLYLLVDRSCARFGELTKEKIFVAIDRMSYADPDNINAADCGQEFSSAAYSLKEVYGKGGNSTLQLDFSLTENEILKAIYQKGEVTFEELKKIEMHLSASIIGRKMHSRANVALKRDLFNLNQEGEM